MGISDQDLDHLSELLFALPHDNMPMTLSELDGYITGILACPSAIPPSDWLPHVWGETGEANFPDVATAETTISAVMAHYNSAASELLKSPWIEPIYEIDQNSNDTLWEPWVDGFTRAMRLRPEIWSDILDRADEEAQSSLIFLMALQEVYEGASKFSEEEIDALDAEAPDLIPNCVASILCATRPEIALGVKSTRRPRARNTRPGRNDKCPCGSGRKYKQCCGAN